MNDCAVAKDDAPNSDDDVADDLLTFGGAEGEALAATLELAENSSFDIVVPTPLHHEASISALLSRDVFACDYR